MRCTLQASWEAHQSWVRDIQWCCNSPLFQLVSVGDRIAWWDLSSARVNMSSSNIGMPGHSNRSGNLMKGAPVSLGSVNSRSSSSGVSSQSCKLVQTVEFQTRGRYASKIFVSDDGRSLVTVSDSGILYILHQLTNHWRRVPHTVWNHSHSVYVKKKFVYYRSFVALFLYDNVPVIAFVTKSFDWHKGSKTLCRTTTETFKGKT